MAYRGGAENQWRSVNGYEGEEEDDFLGPMATQTPQHPIPNMQGAFEESMLETINEEDEPMPMARKDSVYRRKVLLERPQYERTVAGKWKQRAGERYHPLWKIVAQISFGMHLLHQGLAKSDEEVLKILQNHVDEVDGFLERTTEDFELAQHDINERVRYLNLPLEHGDVFDSMLGDRAFRAAMVEGNIKIEHIIDRTQVALNDSMKDVKKGFDGTRELAKYLKKLGRTWQVRDDSHNDVFDAMIRNTDGWSGAFVILQDKARTLNESLEYLRGIISEIQRLVGIASRRDIPKLYGSRSQGSSVPHSKQTSRRGSLSPPRSPRGYGAGLRTAPILKPQAYEDDLPSNDRYRQREQQQRSKPQVRYAEQTKQDSADARAQLPSRRASFSDRTRNIAKRLSIRSPTKEEFAKDAKAYPQTAAEPTSGPWTSTTKETAGDRTSRHRKTQSMVSPHTPYDLDYLLRVTPSDTTISPMRDSELAGLRSATNHLISPMDEIIAPRTAPMPSIAALPPVDPPPPMVLPSNNKITTIKENVQGESSGSDESADQFESQDQVDALLRDMGQNISQAAAVRPLKPKVRELPLRDYRQKMNGTTGDERPNVRASSIYSRATGATDLKSMYSPPQSEKDNLMMLLRANTDTSSVYEYDNPTSAHTEGTLSPPPGNSSAAPSPLHFGGATKPTYFSENAASLDARIVDQNKTNADIFPPRQASRMPPRGEAVAPAPQPPPPEAPQGQTLKPASRTSPSLIALTSATVTGPEPDFPFLSATVNGPEPDFPFAPPSALPHSATDTQLPTLLTPGPTATKHPDLVDRIKANTQATDPSTSMSNPTQPLTQPPPLSSSTSAPTVPTAAATGSTPERTRRRDVPPNLNLKLFPPPDQYSRAASPHSPKALDLRPLSPTNNPSAAGSRSITPLGGPPYGTTATAASSTAVPNGGFGSSLLAPPQTAGVGGGFTKPQKSPGWRRVFSPGLLTGKLRDKDKKGHRRGGGGSLESSEAGTGSNGRITPLIGNPALTGSSVALGVVRDGVVVGAAREGGGGGGSVGGGSLGGSVSALGNGGRSGGGSLEVSRGASRDGSGRGSEERPVVRGLGGTGSPF